MTFFYKHAKDLNARPSRRCSPACRRRPPSTTRSATRRQRSQRRNEVLRQMVKNGYITQAEGEQGRRSGPLGLKRRHPLHRAPRALLLRLRAGAADRALRRRRRAPRRAAHPHDDRPDAAGPGARGDQPALRRPEPARRSAIVAIDPANGKIRAMASSGTYQHRKFNLAAQGHRQPGSTFKTFVLTTAIRQGVEPGLAPTTPRSRSTSTTPTTGTGRSRPSGTRYIGTVSLTRATLSSDNTVYAQLILDLGPKKVCETAKLLGITTHARLLPGRGSRRPDAAASRRWRWRTRTRRSRAAASATARRRSSGSCSRTARARTSRSAEGKRVLTDGQAYEVTQGAQDERARRAPAPPRTTAARRPARPARPTRSRTPGSSATRRSSRPPCGSATRTPASPCQAHRAAPTPAPVWHDFMLAAHGDYCDDFPEPTEPAEFSPFFGKYSSTGSARTGEYVRTLRDRITPDQKYDPRFYEDAPLDAPQDRDASRPARPARDTRSWERERERQWEWRRTAPPLPADPGPWPSST